MSTSLTNQRSFEYLMESLSSAQRLYVEARARGSLPVPAARIAGFSDANEAARVLESDPTVRSAVEMCIRTEAHRQALTRSDVLEKLHDALMVAENTSEQVSALREYSKIQGYYEPQRLEVSGEIKHSIERMAQLSDVELAKLTAIDGEYTPLDFEDAETRS